MSDIIFRRHGKCFVPSSAQAQEYKELPPGTYSIQLHQSPMAPPTLHIVVADDIGAPGKLYGSTEERAKRVLATFKARPGITTGVLLAGEKGTGKTLLAKRICEVARTQHNIPTLLLSEALGGTGFAEFLTDIRQPAIILVDEMEKVYNEPEKQHLLLPILDGAFSGHKLFIFIVNDAEQLVDMLKNRPGRIHYAWRYSRLENEVVREYAQDNLKNKEHIAGLLRMMQMVRTCSFDVLKSLIWEMNQYGEKASKAVRNLNIEYDMTLAYYAEVTGLEGTPHEGFKADTSVVLNMAKLSGRVVINKKDPPKANDAKNPDPVTVMRNKLLGLVHDAQRRNEHKIVQARPMGGSFLSAPHQPFATPGVAYGVKDRSEAATSTVDEPLTLLNLDVMALSDEQVMEHFQEFAVDIEFTMQDLVDENSLEGTFTFQTEEFLIKLSKPRYGFADASLEDCPPF